VSKVRGWRCWFCGRKYAKPGEHPTVWVEFFCNVPDCPEETWRWGP
jgi:hypothetical protein